MLILTLSQITTHEKKITSGFQQIPMVSKIFQQQ